MNIKNKICVYGFICSVALASASCKSSNGKQDDHSESADKIANDITSETPDAAESDNVEIDALEEEQESHAASPFDKVDKWVISITAETSIYNPISESEAARINALEETDEHWADYDEEEGQWYEHGSAMTEISKKTITDPTWVKRLNALMDDPNLSEYREEVTIRGNVAYAKWYGGNRGGGIEEEFPSDIASYLQ